jgi:DNA-binding phage protein
MALADQESNRITAERNLKAALLKAEEAEKAKALAIAAIAGNMLKRNRPIDEIIEDTGLTREEVEKLRNDL